ncbi:MAG: hypothetical protein AAF211_04025 [Myxococcota bacterium]
MSSPASRPHPSPSRSDPFLRNQDFAGRVSALQTPDAKETACDSTDHSFSGEDDPLCFTGNEYTMSTDPKPPDGFMSTKRDEVVLAALSDPE